MAEKKEKKSLTELAGDVERYKKKIESCRYFNDMLEAHKDCDWKWFHVFRDKDTKKGSVNIGNSGVYADACFPVQTLIKVNPNLEKAWSNFWEEMIMAYATLRDDAIQKLQVAVTDE